LLETVKKLSKPPPLDSALAAPCEVPDAPSMADYDVWQDWMVTVLGALGQCAAGTVS